MSLRIMEGSNINPNTNNNRRRAFLWASERHASLDWKYPQSIDIKES